MRGELESEWIGIDAPLPPLFIHATQFDRIVAKKRRTGAHTVSYTIRSGLVQNSIRYKRAEEEDFVTEWRTVRESWSIIEQEKKEEEKKRNSWRDELMLLPAGSKLVHVRSLYRSPPPNNVGQQRGGRAVENQAAFVESTFWSWDSIASRMIRALLADEANRIPPLFRRFSLSFLFFFSIPRPCRFDSTRSMRSPRGPPTRGLQFFLDR